ncbi:Chromatin modification-related protein eaf6 like [Verticillium longisporum]|uniref:Chromatin modification-related protein EAF6 n=1 Tax=Verticillium longisporum TaxID=100787 RepID=A0A8I2ZJH4_VERLO|nr:Chromatin modification-related protein eaf6 like [Verticillium longisporum]
MAENVAPTTGIAGATPSLQMYKQEQVKLKAMLEQRNQVARRLAAIESDIETKEAAYLDSTPHGNIIAGFDNYIKGTSGAGAQRRKQGNTEQHRVFSRSSISYRPGSALQEVTTPGSVGSTPASHAPTPMSTSFKDKDGATPTSTTAGKGKKNKKQNEEDSEAESHAPNKKRINFGAARK